MPEDIQKNTLEDASVTKETELIEKIIKRKDKIRKVRQQYEKDWLINIAFLYGKHYFTVEKRPYSGLDERIYWELKNLERKRKTRRTANYILPLYRSLLARMLMFKANVDAEPTTRSERDIASAKIAKEVLEDFWQMANKNNYNLDTGGMILVLMKLFGFMLTCGHGWLRPYFNPKTTSKTLLGGEMMEAEIGEVEVRIRSPFDVFADPLNRFVIEQEILDIEQIEKQYDKKVKAEDIGMTEIEQQLLSLLESGSVDNYENCAKVYRMYESPSPKHKDGRFIVITGKNILHEGTLPPEYKGRVPLFRFDYLDLLMAVYPQGMVNQLISLQEEYNNTISKLAAYKKWFAGKLKVPLNAKLQTKYDDEVGQIVQYRQGFEPHFESPPNPPEFLFSELMRIQRNMEDISGQHDASMGRVPSGAKSGKAIENLSETDNSQLTPVLLNVEQKLTAFCETVLDIMQARYSEPRLLNITGETLQGEVKTFMGEQLKGNRRIKITLGSALPVSKGARQSYILDLHERQLITPQKTLEMLEFGDVEGIYHSIDENQAKSENQEMLKGNQAIVMEFDDHTVHAKTHSDFMKDRKKFMKLPSQVQQIFLQHYKEHQDYLLAEQQAAMSLQTKGGQLPPPAAPEIGAETGE